MKDIKILGTGCPKCNKLMQNTEAAARELGIECQIEKVTDIKKITSFGVMMTPALVIDGEVQVMGRVPEIAELKAILS
jgi:small redox-active disulfide protein 2